MTEKTKSPGKPRKVDDAAYTVADSLTRAPAPASDYDLCGDEDCDPPATPDEERFAQQLRLLNEIGLALSAVRDIDDLLELILTKSRELTGADAGTLYMRNDLTGGDKGDTRLYFRLAQNDSIDTTIKVGRNTSVPVTRNSLAGYVALTGETLCFPDVYELPRDAPYQFNPSFDREHNYRTRSVLVVPMKNHEGVTIGVLQLINRKGEADVQLDDDATVAREVLAFDVESIGLAASVASQAAVALENNLLLQSIRDLFESFVMASTRAIEDRDPSTKGHSERVTKLTLAMAVAASEATEGPFKDVHYTPRQLTELRYAGLLHDFGKIGVRENILTKSHKLEPLRFDVVKSRLALVRQTRRTECAQRKADALTEQPRPVGEALVKQYDAQLQNELKEIDSLGEMLLHANDPAVTVLPDDDYARQQDLLGRLQQLEYEDENGKMRPVLTPEEKDSLSIRKGSLTLDEYRQIQTHAHLSYQFLEKISWTKEFSGIPEIAYCHHEKLNGKGYPRGVTAPDIPLQSRMMTIADIYDALTAADRPYKKAMPVDLALQILQWEAREGALDPDVLSLFIEKEIYKATQHDAPTGMQNAGSP